MFNLWIFLLFNLWIFYISWHSFTRPRSHGFFRFFVFESLLLMGLRNSAVWLIDPFSPLQIISWACLAGSAVLAGHGFYLLRTLGSSRGGLEDTTVLVETGAFRFIRHPLYASLLLCAVGIFFKQPSLVNTAFLAGIFSLLTMMGRIEEEENLQNFGTLYADYMRRTRMFIPFVF